MGDLVQFIHLINAASNHAGAVIANVTICGSVVELTFLGDDGKEFTHSFDLEKMSPHTINKEVVDCVTYIAGMAKIALHPTAHSPSGEVH